MSSKPQGKRKASGQVTARLNRWWVICLMASLAAPPALATEPGVVSRAVEVSPPKGWTPDTPLFHEEAAASSHREASPSVAQEEGARAPASVPSTTTPRPARRLVSAMSEEATSVGRMREPRSAGRAVAEKREPVQKTAPVHERGAHASAGAPVKDAKAAKAAGAKVSKKAASTATASAAPRASVRVPAGTHQPTRDETRSAMGVAKKASAKAHGAAPAKATERLARTDRPLKPVAASHTASVKSRAVQDDGRARERVKSPHPLTATHRKVAGAGGVRPPEEKARRGEKATAAQGRQQASAKPSSSSSAKQRERAAHAKAHQATAGRSGGQGHQKGRQAAHPKDPSQARLAQAQHTAKRAQAGGRPSSPSAKKG